MRETFLGFWKPWIAILSLGLTSAALVGAQGMPAPLLPESSTRLSDHVQEITGFPNIAIVTGDRATLVVDTGLGARNGATIARVAKKFAKGPTLYLVTTHFHPEHAAGESGFPAGTILVRSTVQQAEMEQNGANMVTMFSKFNPQFGELLKGATLRTPDIVFDNEMTIDLGGVTARILWLGAAHTKGDQLIFVEPDSVLISGDVVQNKVVPGVAGEGGSFQSWIQVLDKLELLKPRIVMPTHSSPGDGSLIAQHRAFMIDMQARTLELKKQGVPLADAQKRMTEVFKTAYREWANNKEWNNVNSVPGFVQRVYTEAK